MAPAHDYSTILDLVKKYAAESKDLNPDEIRDDAELVGDLQFYSLDFVCLIMDIEDALSIKIPEAAADDAEEMRTVESLARCIQNWTRRNA